MSFLSNIAVKIAYPGFDITAGSWWPEMSQLVNGAGGWRGVGQLGNAYWAAKYADWTPNQAALTAYIGPAIASEEARGGDDFFSGLEKVTLGSIGFGVGALTGASIATGGGVTAKTLAVDAAGLAAGAGIAATGIADAGVVSETTVVAPASTPAASPSLAAAAPGESFVGPATGAELAPGVQASGAIVTPLAAQAPIEAAALPAAVSTGAGSIATKAASGVASSLTSSELGRKVRQLFGLDKPAALTTPAPVTAGVSDDGSGLAWIALAGVALFAAMATS